MNVNVKWDNVPNSRWAQGHIDAEASRLERHLPANAHLHLRVGQEGQQYRTKVHVHALGRDWVALGSGENMWAGISAAFDKILRKLGEFKSSHKNRIHSNVRRFRDQTTLYL